MTNRAFIVLRKDEPGSHAGDPVAVYTVDEREACRRDLENKRRVNPDSFYYVLDKPLNPKARPRSLWARIVAWFKVDRGGGVWP